MKKLRGYEYEMMLAHIDERKAAIRISNISLASSSGGFATKRGIRVCGLGLCAIRMTKEIKPGQSDLTITRHVHS